MTLPAVDLWPVAVWVLITTFGHKHCVCERVKYTYTYKSPGEIVWWAWRNWTGADLVHLLLLPFLVRPQSQCWGQREGATLALVSVTSVDRAEQRVQTLMPSGGMRLLKVSVNKERVWVWVWVPCVQNVGKGFGPIVCVCERERQMRMGQGITTE